ncbi:MAG TPA: DUF2975 domain-containing protein [Syntrophomonadaceae bacterium]|nr:DUF2975 domain-containing protein [Syntrophomonadaceae bacterium]
MKMFNKYEKVSPLLTVFQAGIIIAVLWTFTGILLSILSLMSVLPTEILNKQWVNMFLPSTNLAIGSLVFPISYHSEFLPHVLLYAGVAKLPLLALLYYATIQFKKIFYLYDATNEAFTRTNSTAFKNMAIAILFITLVQFAVSFGYGAFLSLIINTYEKSSTYWIGVRVDIPMIFMGILVAAIFFGLANIFSHGLELKEENDAIV